MNPIKTSEAKARLIAFYLPQFHPISENDRWWGPGFTEWTNVAKAKPLFPGHYQPHIPADLGFYDLRVSETRAAQAEMAKKYGIEGFCYWHYWFNGKRLLEKPFNEVLKSGEPDFPFCLAWANESWTGVWHNLPNKIMMEQTYGGEKDYTQHFYSLLPAFHDKRYIKVEDKPLFAIYRSNDLQDAKGFTSLWNKLAIKEGLKGLFFVGITGRKYSDTAHYFDGFTYNLPATFINHLSSTIMAKAFEKITGNHWQTYTRRYLRLPKIIQYSKAVYGAFKNVRFEENYFPSILPNWDNTPRCGLRGVVLHDSRPEIFQAHLKEALSLIQDKKRDKRIIFIKSWNEWAEGNYLEPDQKFGHEFLKMIKEEVFVDNYEETPYH